MSTYYMLPSHYTGGNPVTLVKSAHSRHRTHPRLSSVNAADAGYTTSHDRPQD